MQAKHPDFLGFDGIDWDLEGNDDGTYDTLNPTVLNIVGEMSQVRYKIFISNVYFLSNLGWFCQKLNNFFQKNIVIIENFDKR